MTQREQIISIILLLACFSCLMPFPCEAAENEIKWVGRIEGVPGRGLFADANTQRLYLLQDLYTVSIYDIAIPDSPVFLSQYNFPEEEWYDKITVH
ncbi:MAG TPA: hypothetical protein PLB62_14465, partial [Candidatus Sumerlaeota bacterium]|nr:hypothetical protein [Candidatus Sumerlaeota bacterium]